MKKIQRINVIDIESTCWPDQISPGGEEQRKVAEIIEIGIVQVNVKTLKIENKQSYLVKPVDYPILSQYCIDLTGITNKLLEEEGTTLEYAIARMMSEFKTMKYEFSSWGDYDRSQFERECERKNIQYPFHKTHLNLKYLLSSLVGSKVQRNVDGFLDFLHMPFEGDPHRGVDDAYNVAKMYIKIMKYINSCILSIVDINVGGDEYHRKNIQA